ncbi:transporter substrate-binding domain-containing protein [Actinomadura sp. B10D3]|uniref:transporter substrate-binding domain-containing protein n=1 Tax=Actinomadura sp. B10D3 TaxID=3153557 RepID=UPI00325CCA26
MHAARSNLTLVATAVLTVLAILFLVVALAAAPLVHGDDGPPSVTDRDTLVIGVRDAPPGLARRAGDGSLQGFDIDVSTYIAGRLGVTSGDLTFRALAPDGWETALNRGTVDMVVAAYTITPERKARVTFAGPYYERYGIGLRKGDMDGCRAVNRILTGMYENGAAETLLKQWFTAPDFDAASLVPRFEGCR